MARLLGALWVLPVAVPMWLFYLLPLWALRKIWFSGRASPWVLRFAVTDDGGWYARRWASWSGFAMPFAILVSVGATASTERHELRHTDQWFALGVLFPVVYVLLLTIGGYHGNPLEVDARHWALSSMVPRRGSVSTLATAAPISMGRDEWD